MDEGRQAALLYAWGHVDAGNYPAEIDTDYGYAFRDWYNGRHEAYRRGERFTAPALRDGWRSFISGGRTDFEMDALNGIDHATGKELNPGDNHIKQRLEYLRGEIDAERISYGEIAELQSLAAHIDDGDTVLLEWAAVPEETARARWSRSVPVAAVPDKAPSTDTQGIDMTHTVEFDEAAARAWLEGPDPETQEYTVAESLNVEEDYGYYNGEWHHALEDLTAKATDAKLLPDGTQVWLTCGGDGVLDGALVTRTYDRPSMKLCSSFLDFGDLIDDRTATGIDCAVSVLSAIHLLATELRRPDTCRQGTPEQFADLKEVQAIVAVDVFRDGDETLTVRQWAERGWEALRDLAAPVIALRNRTGEEITVDLEDDEDTKES